MKQIIISVIVVLTTMTAFTQNQASSNSPTTSITTENVAVYKLFLTTNIDSINYDNTRCDDIVNIDTVHNPSSIYLSLFSLIEFHIDNTDSITITNSTNWGLQDNTYLLYDSNMACIISLENLKKIRKIPDYKNNMVKSKYPDEKEHLFRCTVKKIFIDYNTGDIKTIRHKSFFIKHFFKSKYKWQFGQLSLSFPLKMGKKIIFPNIICYEKDSVLGEYYHRKTKTNKDTVFLFRKFPLQLTDNIWYQYSDSSVLLLHFGRLKKLNKKLYKDHIIKITEGRIGDKKVDIYRGAYTYTFMNKNRISSWRESTDDIPKSVFFIREK